jgi:hypothetical protein
MECSSSICRNIAHQKIVVPWGGLFQCSFTVTAQNKAKTPKYANMRPYKSIECHQIADGNPLYWNFLSMISLLSGRPAADGLFFQFGCAMERSLVDGHPRVCLFILHSPMHAWCPCLLLALSFPSSP